MDLPATESADWIPNARLLLARGFVIKRPMVANIFQARNGKLYLKIDTAIERDNPLGALAPGVYFEIDSNAGVNKFDSVRLKPGIHEAGRLLRACRVKRLLQQSEDTWKVGRSFLDAICGLCEWLDIGVYEISIATKRNFGDVKTTSLPIRRPDFAAGPLTDNERARAQQYMEQWLRDSSRTKPINRHELIAAVNKLYLAFGLKAPRVVIAPSPLVLAVSGCFASALLHVKRHDVAKVHQSQLTHGLMLANDMSKNTVEAAYRALDDTVEYETRKEVEALIDTVTLSAARRSLNSATGAAIDCAVYDSALAIIPRQSLNSIKQTVERAIDIPENDMSRANSDILDLKTLADQLTGGNEQLSELMLKSLTGCRNTLLDAHTQQYHECVTNVLAEVLQLRLASEETYCAWREFATKCGAFLAHEEFCIVSDFPEVLNLDEIGRPHCENAPSHKWKDGWELFHLHGTRVPRQLIEAPETLTVAQIKAERNIEIRRLMIERYGLKRFLIDGDATEIHKDECGTLYSQLVDPVLEPLVMVKVRNSTKEPDGTFKDYFLRVPPHVRTAKQAVAWTFGLREAEYCPRIQT